MYSYLKRVLLIFLTSLLTFVFLDYLPGSLFIQWNGQSITFFQRIILFIILVTIRTIIAEYIMSKIFGGHIKKRNLLLSLLVFGLPLLVIQLVSGINTIFTFITSLSPFKPHTLFYAIFSFTISLFIFEISRLYILYIIKLSNH